MNIPAHLRYAPTHEWVETLPGGVVRIGISDYAQDSLGDIVYINLPQAGQALEKGTVFADIESVKAVSDIYSPVAGTVTAVNEALLDAPELINQDPYGSWLIELTAGDLSGLLNAEDYQRALAEAGA